MTDDSLGTFRLTVVNAKGYGFDHIWGDSYEVKAADYAAARADVLGRVGTDDKPAYERVTRAWVFNADQHRWDEIGGVL